LSSAGNLRNQGWLANRSAGGATQCARRGKMSDGCAVRYEGLLT